MQICCTKKLNDEMGIVPGKGTEENDLFCWSVHLITVKRRKTLVAVNDSNRYGFVLHGLKANDFKHLKELLIQGIRNCLRDEKIKSEIIERYLKAAGELVFKECLKKDILPFIIDHEHKLFYYRGLKEYKSEKGFLRDTCLSSQDQYKVMVLYFFPDLSNPVLK